MELQKALVTRILDEGELRLLRLYNLGPDDLSDDDAAAALAFVFDHWDETREVASRELVSTMIPGFEFVSTNEKTESLCHEVSEELAGVSFNRLLVEGDDLVREHRPLKAAEILAGNFRRLSTSFGKVSTYTAGERADIEFDALTSDKEDGRVIPLPWGPMQDALGGLRGNEVLLFYGRPKQGKTWLLVETAAFLTQRGYKVLFISPEMSRKQILRRTYAVRCRFPYSDMRKKILFRPGVDGSRDNRLALNSVIREYADNRLLIVHTPKDEEEELTLACIEGLAEDHNPDAIIFDQIHYTVPGTNYRDEWRQLGVVTKGLRRISRLGDWPFLGSTQANRDSGKKKRTSEDTDDIAGSDKIPQLVDIAVRIRLHKEYGIRSNTVTAAREADIDGWFSRAHFCTDLSVIPDDDVRVKRLKEDEEKKIKRPQSKKKPSIQKTRRQPSAAVKTKISE